MHGRCLSGRYRRFCCPTGDFAAHWAILLPTAGAVAVRALFTGDSQAPFWTVADSAMRLVYANSRSTVALLLGILVVYSYLFWASRKVLQRLDLESLLEPHRLTGKARLLTVATLELKDVLGERRWFPPPPTYLERRVRRHGSTDLLMDGITATSDAWARGRGVAITGPAGMGKTRLVYEAAKGLPPQTIVLLPLRGEIKNLNKSCRYLRRRLALLVFDDINEYAASSTPQRSKAPLAVQLVMGGNRCRYLY